MFQLDTCSPMRLNEEIITLYKPLLLRVARPIILTTLSSTIHYDIDNHDNHLPLDDISFGTALNLFLEESRLDMPLVNRVKGRCRENLIELLKEMRKRLPANIHQLHSISGLTQSVVWVKSSGENKL